MTIVSEPADGSPGTIVPLTVDLRAADGVQLSAAHWDAGGRSVGCVVAQVWIEPAMGHAEVATTGDLIERIGGWVLAASERRPAVCDDDSRD
jgi:hypothetical protein